MHSPIDSKHQAHNSDVSPATLIHLALKPRPLPYPEKTPTHQVPSFDNISKEDIPKTSIGDERSHHNKNLNTSQAKK